MTATIKISGLCYSYPEPRTVLDGVDLEVAEGETLGLVGPNGAGKTTLFLLLAGVLKPSAGHAEVLGKPIGSDELRGRIGVVFQNVDDQLFSTTVADDVAFGPLNMGLTAAEATARVTRALERVGLSGFEERVPHHLSSGEKRRVGIAAVLSLEPGVYLLDEPNSDLDPRARREQIELLRTIPETKIIASHDFELLIEVCDRVAILDGGRIQCCGEPLPLLADEERMREHGLEVPNGVRALEELRRDGRDLLGRSR